MREDVHPGGIEPDEERPIGPGLTADEVLRRPQELLIHGGHACDIQWTGVFDLAVGRRLDDAARPILLPESRVLRIEIAFRLLFGVEMIEIAEELVEAVLGR